MEGLKKLGTGRTAEAFLTPEGRVLKLFYAGYPKDSVEKELRNAGMVDALGIPAPRCYGSVEMDGRVGIVYERAAGESLLSVLLRTGDAEGCARVMAELHGKLLACSPLPPDVQDAEGLAQMRGKLADAYLRHMGVEKAQLADWLPVIKRRVLVDRNGPARYNVSSFTSPAFGIHINQEGTEHGKGSSGHHRRGQHGLGPHQQLFEGAAARDRDHRGGGSQAGAARLGKKRAGRGRRHL